MDQAQNINIIADQDETLKLLKQLSLQDFLHVGMDQVAYIRAVEGDVPEAGQHAIYAADGSQISVVESYDMAVAAIRMNDMTPITVQ